MQPQVRTLTILGATGSIGLSTLDVVARHPGRYRVFALSAHRQVEALAGLLSSSSARALSEERAGGNGVLMIALNPEAFNTREA